MFADIGFQQLEVAVGQGIFWYGGGMVFHRNDVKMVVTTLGTTHATIHHEGINFPSDVFCTNENGGVVVEEWYKVVNTAPFGLLVADEADDIVLTLFAQLENATESFLHRDVDTSVLTA